MSLKVISVASTKCASFQSCLGPTNRDITVHKGISLKLAKVMDGEMFHIVFVKETFYELLWMWIKFQDTGSSPSPPSHMTLSLM